MSEKDRFAVEECLYAITGVLDFSGEFNSAEELIEDRKTYDAVLMNFVVLGESANRLSEGFRASLPMVDWRAIRGFRNFIAHDYFGIDQEVVWAAIKYHLPELKKHLENSNQR